MMIKIGINGFGRIGRLAFRSSIKREGVQVVAINDLLDVDYLAYMLKYDSVHGAFDGTVEVKDGVLFVNGNAIRITAERDPSKLKWDEVEAEYVIESTGFFLNRRNCRKAFRSRSKKSCFICAL
jgi:glyceraldehyde 3-phosphate dehydrogenase